MMLTPQARELLRGPNFTVIATINADGTLQQSVVWVTERDGNVVFSTVEGRAKHRNLVRDPRIGVLVLDRADGYRYSQIRGIARLESTNADALIDELSRKYTGETWVETQTRPRVNVIVTPTHQHDYSD
jgi:PPOX class probable F420-dependent enzyme